MDQPQAGEIWLSDEGIEVRISALSNGFVRFFLNKMPQVLSEDTFLGKYRRRVKQFTLDFSEEMVG